MRMAMEDPFGFKRLNRPIHMTLPIVAASGFTTDQPLLTLPTLTVGGGTLLIGKSLLSGAAWDLNRGQRRVSPLRFCSAVMDIYSLVQLHISDLTNWEQH